MNLGETNQTLLDLILFTQITKFLITNYQFSRLMLEIIKKVGLSLEK